ncbi:unnamed protein product [Parnassius mnemosyne]|uniref:Reverse transcriptase domain-containing protein n=1 Tax=Parnassius mnemosyne TaxID=213953 RepID=A0AAV1M8F0_9NEOP
MLLDTDVTHQAKCGQNATGDASTGQRVQLEIETWNVIPLHKKGSTRICGNDRTVVLISHASKIILYILNSTLQSYLQWQIPSEQAGFVKGRGTREQIVNVRQIIEKNREFNTSVFMCFIDYSKAFDCVR